MKIFKREKNKIILTYSVNISDEYGWRTKATCFFKNGILYKIKEDNRSNKSKIGKNQSGNNVEDGNSAMYTYWVERLKNEWYEEDESRKVSCCSKGIYSSYWSTHEINFEIIKIIPESRLKNDLNRNTEYILKLKEEYPNLPIGQSALIVLAEINY